MHYDDTFFEFFKTTEDNSIPGKVAAWIIEDSKGRLAYHPDQICHANLNPNKHPLAEGSTVYSSLLLKHPFRKDAKYIAHAEAYWSFLFDKDHSPWKQIVPQLEVIRNPEGRMVAFKVTDIHKMPIQLILNFFIATRMPREQPCLINTFYLLTKHDIPAWCALACAFSYRVDGSKMRLPSTSFVHYIFDGPPKLKQLREGTPTLQKILYGDVRTYDQQCRMKDKGQTYKVGPFQINSIWRTHLYNEGAFEPTFKRSIDKAKKEEGKHFFEKLWKLTKPQDPPPSVSVKTFVRNMKEDYEKGLFND